MVATDGHDIRSFDDDEGEREDTAFNGKLNRRTQTHTPDRGGPGAQIAEQRSAADLTRATDGERGGSSEEVGEDYV